MIFKTYWDICGELEGSRWARGAQEACRNSSCIQRLLSRSLEGVGRVPLVVFGIPLKKGEEGGRFGGRRS